MAKVLITEDNADILHGLSDQLKKDGYEVVTAENGDQALEVAFKTHPDLILLDFFLPKKDGLGILHDLRADSWGKTVPVIVLSSLTDNQQIIAAQRYNITDFLIKTDWTYSDVSSQVAKRLEEKDSKQSK